MADLNLTDLGIDPEQIHQYSTADLLALETRLAQRATVQTKRGQLYMAAQELVRITLAARDVRTRFVKHDDLPAHQANRTEHHVFEIFDREGNLTYMTSLTTEGARALRDQLVAADLG